RCGAPAAPRRRPAPIAPTLSDSARISASAYYGQRTTDNGQEDKRRRGSRVEVPAASRMGDVLLTTVLPSHRDRRDAQSLFFLLEDDDVGGDHDHHALRVPADADVAEQAVDERDLGEHGHAE